MGRPKKEVKLKKSIDKKVKAKKNTGKKIKDSFFVIGHEYDFYDIGDEREITAKILKATKEEFLLDAQGEIIILNRNWIKKASPHVVI